MKIIFITLTVTFSILSAKAKTNDSLKIVGNDTTVYASFAHEAEFPGGISEFYKYVGKSITIPLEARLNKQHGRVFVQMTVEKDGSLTHVKVIKSVAKSLDAEAIRVVSSSPKWIPATQNGYIVRTQFILPIVFEYGN